MDSAKPSSAQQGRYDLELWMGWLLRGGVFLCGVCIAVGWVFVILRGDPELGSQTLGQGSTQILLRLGQGDWTVFVPLGVRLLILLPVLRVALSVVLFIEKRDGVYVGLSIAVLLILLGSIFLGLKG